MSDPADQQVTDLKVAINELTDALNRSAACTERNTMATRWLASIIEWSKAPFWRRGASPKWPG